MGGCRPRGQRGEPRSERPPDPVALQPQERSAGRSAPVLLAGSCPRAVSRLALEWFFRGVAFKEALAQGIGQLQGAFSEFGERSTGVAEYPVASAAFFLSGGVGARGVRGGLAPPPRGGVGAGGV